VQEVKTAIEQAFRHWEEVEVASGLGTDLYFVADLETEAVLDFDPNNLFKVNRGAEIDIFWEPMMELRKGR
jgi:hypothetical protein